MTKRLWNRTSLIGLCLVGLAAWGCGGGDAADSTATSSAPDEVQQDSKDDDAEPSHRIVGYWRGNVDLDKKDVEDMKLTDAQFDAIAKMQMSVEFREDGTMRLAGTTQGQPDESLGKWKLLQDGKKNVTIRSSEDDGPTKELELTFEGDDAFSMPLPGPLERMGAMHFRRLR